MSARKRRKARRKTASDARRGTSGSVQVRRRDLLLILGMHRSGTSALTGVLGKLGISLGDELLPPTPDNPKGYFENAGVVAAQETLFTALHRAWHDPRALPENWSESVAADEARETLFPLVHKLFDSASVAAVKDPRSSRVVPLWLDVAAHSDARTSALLMVRHPNEVAGSLHKRDGLSRSRAHLLWMTYLLEAERSTRAIPRAFVSYEALLADWRSELARIQKRIGSVLPATPAMEVEIDRFLDASLRNNQAEKDEHAVSPFEPVALELYGLALKCALDPGDSRADDEFDAIAQKLGRLAAQYLDAPLRLEDELQRQAMEKSRVEMSLQLAAMRELWRPAFPTRAPGSCRLYYREASASFIESRSVSADPELHEDGRRVLFTLPPNVHFEHLRVDPDDAPGVFSIQSLAIGGIPIDDLANQVSGVSEFSLPATSPSTAIRFAALGDDPHFELSIVGKSDEKKLLQVEMRFRVETVLSEITTHLRESGETLERGQEDLSERQRTLNESVLQLERHLVGLDEFSCTISADLGVLGDSTRELRQEIDEERNLRRRDVAKLMELVAATRQAIVATRTTLIDRLNDDLIGLREALNEESQRRAQDVSQVLGILSETQQGAVHSRAAASARFDNELSGFRETVSVLLNGAHELHLAVKDDSRRRDRDVAHMVGLLDAAHQTAAESHAYLDHQQKENFSQIGEVLAASQKHNEILASEIISMRVQQDLLMTWARRRSPSFWWRRIRGLR